MARLTKYTIEIQAQTADDAALALEQVSRAIASGAESSGGWNSDGQANGYQFDTEPLIAYQALPPFPAWGAVST